MYNLKLKWAICKTKWYTVEIKNLVLGSTVAFAALMAVVWLCVILFMELVYFFCVCVYASGFGFIKLKCMFSIYQ